MSVSAPVDCVASVSRMMISATQPLKSLSPRYCGTASGARNDSSTGAMIRPGLRLASFSEHACMKRMARDILLHATQSSAFTVHPKGRLLTAAEPTHAALTLLCVAASVYPACTSVLTHDVWEMTGHHYHCQAPATISHLDIVTFDSHGRATVNE